MTGSNPAELFSNIKLKGLSIPDTISISQELLKILQKVIVIYAVDIFSSFTTCKSNLF